MRNFTKFLALGLVFLSFQTSTIAQSLGIPDGVFYISGPFTTNRLESHLAVENTTNNPINVLVRCDKSDSKQSFRLNFCNNRLRCIEYRS
ncbi:MAG: hypothetical protein IPP51_15615 [Bacteroidetes bacterium]|nr:hypothetical protein [Bacteroidota bacterium]